MKLRQPIKSVEQLSCKQLKSLVLTHSGNIAVTEKTDGQAFEFGVDDLGFFSRSSNSTKMRKCGDYYNAALKKFGKDINPKISEIFDFYHSIFHNGSESIHVDNYWSVKGELFGLPFFPIDWNTRNVTFVATPYHIDKMSINGAFIIHSQLSEQNFVDVDMLSEIFDNNEYGVRIDSDFLKYINIDFSSSLKSTASLLPNRLYRYDQESHEALQTAKQKLLEALEKTTVNFDSKWGPETEGFVFHFNNYKLKLINSNFYRRKQQWVAM